MEYLFGDLKKSKYYKHYPQYTSSLTQTKNADPSKYKMCQFCLALFSKKFPVIDRNAEINDIDEIFDDFNSFKKRLKIIN